MTPLTPARQPLRPLRASAALMAAGLMAVLLSGVSARAAERVTLTNGFDMVCDHREIVGDHVRLYLSRGSSSFVEFPAHEIAAVEPAPDLPAAEPASAQTAAAKGTPSADKLTPTELHEMLGRAGARHNVDAELLASVVHAESGGHAHAVSRAGAQGLMQLMPGTAANLGVGDSFVPEQNVNGGTAYLDTLLTRYHDNLALALAAYNAGPAAVDRYHGIPPYRETRAYVARVIREFNRRVLAERAAAKAAHHAPAATQIAANRDASAQQAADSESR